MGKNMNKERILLVDDENFQRVYFAEMLEKEGYEVVTAAGGEEALEIIEEVQPDLVLLDIIMPRLSGIEVCSLIRSSTSYLKSLPIVMLTHVHGDEYIVEALDAGADDYIIKDVDERIVYARVRAHLRSKKHLDKVSRDMRHQSVVADVVLDFSSSDNLRDALSGVTKHVARHIGGHISVVRFDKEGDKGSVIACSDLGPESGITIDITNYPELKRSIESGRPVIVDDMHSDLLTMDVADKLLAMDLNSLIIIPMLAKKEAGPVLLLRARGLKKIYDKEEVRLCRTIASAIERAITNTDQ